MNFKQMLLFSSVAVLLMSASVASAAPSELVPEQKADDSKSYFGYQPEPKDSYKKLSEEVLEYSISFAAEFQRLFDKIQTLYKKVIHKKDNNYGGYNYGDLQQMQKLLFQQKAALDALRSERPVA